MAATKLTTTFHGGVGAVTGSNFLLSDGQTSVIIDCGFFQGSKVAEGQNRAPFPFDPKQIAAAFITHAHLDHIGRLPLLVKTGFRGTIYSTPPTKEIAELNLLDSLGVLEKEARRDKQPLIYTEVEVAAATARWQTADYHESLTVGDWSVTLLDSGHILGSAMIRLEHRPSGTVFVFTGDLGNSPSLLLKDTEPITDADYLVMESVYGDRNHESHKASCGVLEDVIEDTMRAGGTLMIPAFSIERTQELLYDIEQMMEQSRIPLVPVFLDSPLAIKVTSIYSRYQRYLNQTVNHGVLRGDGLFNFPQLHKTLTTEESKNIAGFPSRKIIIAGSGMSNGGRILHHERRYLPDSKSALLLAGYQAAGSLGRQLQDGATWVKIMGEDIPVRARIVSISGYSAHKGADDLFSFAQADADRAKKVFVVLGEPKSSLFLTQRLRDYLGLDAVVPEAGETFSVVV